ncbi:MAG: hypothetical protein H6686_00915 [Fibrobacteria bacterium]|nr:hypothetical protein [Fibrobacteria bacterium]
MSQLVQARRSVFDPTLFGDPLAARVEWTPLKRGGTNFRTHRLHQESPVLVRFKPSIQGYAFPLAFLLGGVIPLAILIHAPGALMHFQLKHGLLLLFSLPFFGIGIWSWRTMTRVSSFDKREGWYWAGGSIPSANPHLVDPTRACPLSDIKAIQILSESVRGDKGRSYSSLELNLVLADASRRQVVDHGGGGLEEEARTLAEFLGVPLWNAANGYRPWDEKRDGAASW